jgi:hypothetical protein
MAKKYARSIDVANAPDRFLSGMFGVRHWNAAFSPLVLGTLPGKI